MAFEKDLDLHLKGLHDRAGFRASVQLCLSIGDSRTAKVPGKTDARRLLCLPRLLVAFHLRVNIHSQTPRGVRTSQGLGECLEGCPSGSCTNEAMTRFLVGNPRPVPARLGPPPSSKGTLSLESMTCRPARNPFHSSAGALGPAIESKASLPDSRMSRHDETSLRSRPSLLP